MFLDAIFAYLAVLLVHAIVMLLIYQAMVMQIVQGLDMDQLLLLNVLLEEIIFVLLV
jgi:hypothetical protein